jgi:WD40 repeat protein
VVQIIDVATAEVKRPALPTRHSSWVRSVSWSPDGTKLASGSEDKTLRTWEVATGKELSQLRGHGQAVSSLAFKPDDPNVLVTGSWDKTVKLWDLSTSTCLSTMTVDGQVCSVDWSPCGSKMAATCNVRKGGNLHGSVKIWGRLAPSCASRP